MPAVLIRRPHRARGFSLVEVLIAVLVFAIGMLGVVGLQTVGLGASSGSATRSLALALAYDMADRMRANRGAARATDAADRYDGVVPADHGCRARTSSAQNPAPAACTTPRDLAADDLADWQQQVAAQLPQGVGVVCRDSTPDDGPDPANRMCDGAGPALVIKLWWLDRATRTDNAQWRRVAVRVQP